MASMLGLDESGFVTIFLLTSAASYILGMIAHEFGHAVMGWLVGLPPRLIRIGAGPCLLRFRMGTAWFDMRRWPVYAYVSYWPRPAERAMSRIACLSGGFLVNAVLLGAMVALALTSKGADDDRLFWALAIGSSQLALVLTALIPFSMKWGGQKQQSDAYQILRLLRDPEMGSIPTLYAAQMRHVLPDDAPTPVPPPYAAEMIYYLTRGAHLFDEWACENTSAGLQSLLARCPLAVPERALVLDKLAFIEWLQKEKGDAELLDRWSAEAVASMSCPYTQIMRGAALLELGHTARALELLVPNEEVAAKIGRGKMCSANIRLAKARLNLAQLKQNVAQA